MMRKLKLASLAALLLTTPAMPVQATDGEHNAALDEVLTDDRRAKDRARDKYRRPAQTLEFFDVQPDHTVIEYSPGSGWYTRILAPYLAEQGKYIAVNWGPYGDVPQRFKDRVGQWAGGFPASASKYTGVPAEKLSAYFGNELPEELNGQVDRVILPRMLHNVLRWNIADTELRALRRVLKDDGMVGVVQHWAPDDYSYGMTDGNKGYLRKKDVIAMMRLYGFELAKESDHNANPKDKANYDTGVWTLPPSLRKGDEDRARYEEIGESNRMTLLFKKAK